MRNGASDRLAREHDLDPEEVFDLVEMEVHEELDPFLEDDDPLQPLFLQDRKTILAAVAQCRRFYRDHQENGYELMVQSQNEWASRIGEALIAGEYARLAL